MKDGRTTQVSIRLTEEERERIRRCAERAHLKEAVYIRDLALGQKKMILPEEWICFYEPANTSTYHDGEEHQDQPQGT